MGQPVADAEHPVAPLELFFDLVFVFGFTQVTALLSGDPTWTGLGHALLILTALWWVWASYAWLTNTAGAEDGMVWPPCSSRRRRCSSPHSRFPKRSATTASSSAPRSSSSARCRRRSTRRGDGDDELLEAVLRIVPWALAGATLILVAGFVGGAARAGLWVAALAVGFVGPGLADLRGWRVQPAHFVERHGLIVIIAIGESLVAIGVGTRGTRLGAGEIVAAVLGLVVAMSFWLAYFDFFVSAAASC